MLNCNADLDARSTNLEVSIQFTGLQLRPRIAASYPSEQTRTVTLDERRQHRGPHRASLGGRHPEAFAIDVDGCSDRTLAAGADCEVDVTYLGDQVRGNPHLHPVLKMPNDDSLAPQLLVSEADQAVPEETVKVAAAAACSSTASRRRGT